MKPTLASARRRVHCLGCCGYIFLARSSRANALLAALFFLATSTASGSAGLGPIFPINGGMQLAIRPDGTAITADARNTVVTNSVLLREILDSQINNGDTNQSAFNGYYSYGNTRFYYANPDVAANATNGVVCFVHRIEVTIGEPEEYFIESYLVDTNGSPTTAVFVITNATEYLNVESWYFDPTVRVDMNRAGQFAVVWWDQTYGLSDYARARVFNASAQPVGTNSIILNDQMRDDGVYAAYNPVVAIAPNGSSVYAWEDAYLPGSGFDLSYDIYARRVDVAGNAIGSQFRVNSTINCRHKDAEIAVAGDGSFVVVWTQSYSDADGVYLQRFDAAGNRVGEEMRISPYSGADPQIATIPDGRFIVAWQGQDNDGSGIFAQRFQADGSFYGSSLWVNEGATNSQTSPLLGMADDGTFIVKWSEGATNFARWISWDATNQTQIFGPRVLAMSPTYSAAAPITNVTVTFDRMMNAATFATTNAQLIDPLGRNIPIISVQTANNQLFTLNFAPQQMPGRYHLVVGPNIQDANGALMDENSNAVKGEPADTFSGQFLLTSSLKATFPVTEGFESGPEALAGWSFSPGPGTISIVTNNAPHGGTNHLQFITPPKNGNSQSATLVVDLSGQASQTNLFLEFWGILALSTTTGETEFFVELSADGLIWHQVANLGPSYVYTEYFIDLDQAAAANGVALDGDVHIRFRHRNPSGYFLNTSTIFLDDVRVAAGDFRGPKVVGQTPMQLASSNSALNSIILTFDKAVDPVSFTSADVTLVNPQGSVVSPVNAASWGGSGNTQFNVTFPAQTLRGTYRLTVGPNITDTSGNLMNQNGNNSNGESTDNYNDSLTYSPTIATVSGGPVTFSETFENWPSVPTYWSFVTYDSGSIAVANASAPHGGTNHLRFITPPINGNSQSATLVVDLSALAGQTNLFLEFWGILALFTTTGETEFFVELSADGLIWHQVANLGPSYVYSEYFIDLDQAAAANGVALDGDVHIRFRHRNPSGYFLNTSTIFLDDVRIVVMPILGSPSVAANGQFQFQIVGSTGGPFVVQASSNLANWDPIATNLIPGSGFILFNDPFATNFSRRFYRTVLP